MTPCEGCAYKRTIPGDAHIRCTFNWPKAAKVAAEVGARVFPPRFNGGEAQRQWYMFPLNYDPVWGGDCAQRTETADPNLVAKHDDGLLDLIVMGMVMMQRKD